MTWIEALLLGALQGVTEFLPVSSSGHLVLAQHLFGMRDPERNLFFTAVLHLGSLGAILVYFFRDILRLRGRALGFILLGSIPAAAVGLTLKEAIEAAFASPLLVCGCLVVTGAWLFAAERFARSGRTLGYGGAFLIGVAQAIAILPGISRSGATIGAAYLLGLERRDAVRFSFLLGAPAIAGAGALELWKAPPVDVGLTIAAVALCFVVSLGALKLLEMLAVRGKLWPFAIYCVCTGAAAAGIISA